MAVVEHTVRFVECGADAYQASPTVCLEKPRDRTPLDVLHAECARKYNGHVTVRYSTPHRPRRTGYRSGSAHFHGHSRSISEDTGNDFEDVKLYLKRRAMRRGYPAQTMKDGKIRYSLVDGLPLPQSEADASIEQENMLIEEAHQLGAELGVRLIEYEEGK